MDANNVILLVQSLRLFVDSNWVVGSGQRSKYKVCKSCFSKIYAFMFRKISNTRFNVCLSK